jgi:dTDP-4-dehydrorhamnose reductase
VSRYEFAGAILQDRGVKLLPISTGEYPTPTRRPRYSVLDCSRIAAAFAIKQTDWRAALRQVFEALTANS